MLRRVLVLAASLLAAMPGWSVVEPPAEGRPMVTWSLARRDLSLSGWRMRVVTDREGRGWIGSEAGNGGAGKLYQWLHGRWSSPQGAPPLASRTYALALDPAGGLWLCDYLPEDSAAYGRAVVRRFDGRQWSSEEIRPGIWPQAVGMVSSEEGWIVGNQGLGLHRTGGVWRRESIDPGRRDILALRMTDRENGWAAGARGLVARYRQGRWQVVPVPKDLEAEKLFSLDVEEDGRLWVVGSNGLIASWDGMSWRRWPVPTTATLVGLDMVSPRDGWAVGKFGTILRWDGHRWLRQSSPTVADLHDVAMTDAGTGWIVGSGVALRSTVLRPPKLRDISRLGHYPMARQPGRGAAALDVDGDGDLDLFSLQETSLHLYENTGEAAFVEVPEIPALPASPETRSFQSFTWGDVDGDGDPDLLVLGENPGTTWLYRNRGRRRFAVPERLAVDGLGGAGDTGHLVDLDRDGDLDLYLARGALPGPRRLDNPVYRNDGTGRFQPWQRGTGGKGIEMFALWGDLDGDLDLDAVLPGNGNEAALLVNEAGRMRDGTSGSGLDTPLGRAQMHQGGLLDLDLDGDLDLLLLGDRLYPFFNDGAAHFRHDARLFPPITHNFALNSRMSNAGDLNHDGSPEILLQPVAGGRAAVRLLSRGPDGFWRDIAPEAGLTETTGDGVAFGDWDGDGDLDLYITGPERSYLLENRQDDGNYLKLRLHGVWSNRLAVGARVWIYQAGHLGDRAFLAGHRQAGAGFNPSGFQDLSELHFGLDARRRYDVEAVFPSGRRVVRTGVAPGRVLDLPESPAGLRHAVLTLGWARRAWATADPVWEIPKLGLVLLILALWRRVAAPRLGARLLARRRLVIAALLGLYLIAAGALAAERRGAAHAGLLLGFSGLLALLTIADRRLTLWKTSRYLGPYRLQEPLGEGGMGVVYRARHVVSGRTVALKVVHPRRIEQEENRLRFLREARILTRLEHPHIVRVFETGEIDGRGYISMELLDGLSLRRFVEQHGPLEPRAVRSLLIPVAEALAYVHACGIVHRDVKSDNLFLLGPATGPESHRVKLMDFGLARAVDMHTVTGRRALVGTLAYMPPELLRGQPPEPRSDVYSLGVVAYEALTGRLPFLADEEGTLLARIQAGEPVPLRQLRPEVPPDLERLIARMLEREPQERPGAEELVAALEGSGEAAEPAVASSPARAAAGAVDLSTLWEPAARGWKARYLEARLRLAEGRTTEAQVLLVECLEDLKEALRPLDRAERETYSRQHEVAAVLDLMDQVNPGGTR